MPEPSGSIPAPARVCELIIVAPHGAELINLAFAPDDARVLELFPQTNGTPAFAMVAVARDLAYTAMGCEAVPQPAGRRAQDDLRVDVEAVQTWIDDD